MIRLQKAIPFALSALALSAAQWAGATVLVPPTGGAYVADQARQNTWVQDKVGDEIGTVNMIMCVMSGMRGDAMVNQGAYVALIDMNKCQSRGKGGSSAGDSAGAANATDYMTAIVTATQASASDPLVIKAWLADESEDHGTTMKRTIYVHISASEGKSASKPNGVFSMYFCGKAQGDGVGVACQMSGALKSDGTNLTFYQDEGGQTENLSLTNGSSTTGSGQLEGIDQQSNPYAYSFAYDATNFLRSDGVTPVCFDRSRANAEYSTWRYGTYKANGDRLEADHSGFPVKYVVSSPSAQTYYGYWGFWGLWLPQSALDTFGTGNEGVLTRQSNGATETLSVEKKGGKLWKLTRRTAALDDFKGGSMMFWSPTTINAASTTLQSGANYELQWDGVHQVLNVVGQQDCVSNPGRCDSVPMGPFALHASDFPANAKALPIFFPSGGGNGALVLPSSGDFSGSTEVSYRTRETVSTATNVSLDCLNQCTKSGAALTSSFGPSINSPQPYVGNWGPVSSPASSYTYTGGMLTDDGNAHASVDASGVNKADMKSYQWGVTSGLMVSHSDLPNLACAADGRTDAGTQDHYCPGLIDQLTEVYQWETGPNQWNQYFGASVNGSPVVIDAPKDLAFAATSQNIRSGNVSKYAGSTMHLQFNGFGELQGIPGHCVKQGDNTETTNCDQNTRWVPAFDIVDGSAVTEGATPYYVQFLERELRFAKVPLGTCSALTLPTTGSLNLSSTYDLHPDQVLGVTIPTPANPKAAVIDGTVQSTN